MLESDRNFMLRFLGHHEMGNYYRLHPGKALVEGEYNGTKDLFQCVLFNLLGTAKLRDYGLLNQLPFIIRNLVEIVDEEKLLSISELNIAHYDTKLIRMRNDHGDKETLEVVHFDLGDFFEYLGKETYESKVNRTAVFVKRSGLNMLPYHPLGRLILFGVAVGITAVIAESVRAWNHPHDNNLPAAYFDWFRSSPALQPSPILSPNT